MGEVYFYSDNSEGFTGKIDFSRVNSTKKSLEHYSNSLTLDFIFKSTKDFKEKFQVEKEMKICERKIKWWKQQWNFSQEEFNRGCLELKKLWVR